MSSVVQDLQSHDDPEREDKALATLHFSVGLKTPQSEKEALQWLAAGVAVPLVELLGQCGDDLCTYRTNMMVEIVNNLLTKASPLASEILYNTGFLAPVVKLLRVGVSAEDKKETPEKDQPFRLQLLVNLAVLLGNFINGFTRILSTPTSSSTTAITSTTTSSTTSFVAGLVRKQQAVKSLLNYECMTLLVALNEEVEANGGMNRESLWWSMATLCGAVAPFVSSLEITPVVDMFVRPFTTLTTKQLADSMESDRAFHQAILEAQRGLHVLSRESSNKLGISSFLFLFLGSYFFSFQ